MFFVAIVDWTVQNRVAKYQSYLTEAEATAHADDVRARFPKVFVAAHPGGGVGEWLIDPVAETLSVVPIPPTPPPTNDEIYDRVIQSQKVFKGYVLAVNDGSIVPGSGMTGAQLKAAVKAKM